MRLEGTMRLLFVNNLYPPYVVGGNEMLCDEVVGALRARGHHVSVLCGRGRDLPRHPDIHGALEIDLDRRAETFLGGRLPTLWETFGLHVFSPKSYRATRRALATLRPDLVVVWNLYMASLAPLAAVRRSGTPAVVHLFDKWLYWYLCDLNDLLKPVARWKRLLVHSTRLWQPAARALVMPHRMIAVSHFMKAFYARAGFPAGQIDVVHLGVPTNDFTVVPRAPRTAADPLRLLYVGALWEGKGPQTTVRALGRLTRAGVPAHLDVCGGGAARFVESLRKLIAAEGLAGRVTLRGQVERSVVRRFCQGCDVLVFPSQWDEPFAAVPVEAMSCGLPLVATTAGGTPEAVEDGVTGILVPPADPDAMAAALATLAADDGLRLRLGANAARVARERFDIQTYLDRLESCYAGLIARR
jgi:glycosyltransferase involved in cell wall biosynthesis